MTQSTGNLAAQLDQAARRGVVRHLTRGNPDVTYNDIRAAFIEHAARGRYDTWEDAWNTWVDTNHGTLPITLTRCEQCHGKRIDMRRGTVCHTCMGRRQHRRTVRIRATHVDAVT